MELIFLHALQAAFGTIIIVAVMCLVFGGTIKDGADWYLKPLNPQWPIKPLGESTIVGVVVESSQKHR